MPRLRQVPRDEAPEDVRRMYDMLFGDRDPISEPGTATGTPGNWWTVMALVPEIFRHAVAGFVLYRGSSRKLDPLLRELGPDEIEDIDWHLIKVSRRGEDGLRRSLRVSLGDPLGNTRADNAGVFSECETTGEILDALRDRVGEPDGDGEENDKDAHLRAVPDSMVH